MNDLLHHLQVWVAREELKGFRRRSGSGRFGLLLLLLLLASCGDGGTGPGKARVGAEGGTALLEGGSVVLSIPSGALPSLVKFTATQTGSVPASDLLVPGSNYEIRPVETTFDRLVTLTLTYRPADLPAQVRESELRLYQVAGPGWELSVNPSVDTVRNTVSGLIDHLGRFGVMGMPVASVALSPTLHVMAAGKAKQMTAAGLGPSGTTFPGRKVTWSSSNESVATVDSAGLVTAVGGGSAAITATVESVARSATIHVYACSTQTEIPAKECEALADLIDSLTRGLHLEEWMRGPNPCEWRGVTCENGFVSEFGMAAQQTHGSISFSIGDLSHLKRLNLWGNNLTGPIPSSIGGIAGLEVLALNSNDLTGSIPPELGNLSNLRELILHWNQLTGPIPAELGDLSSLTLLRVNGNQLSGPIPPVLGNLSNLRQLVLFDNQLSGSIPTELGALSKLERLSLSLNELSGGIPAELGNLSNLTSLGLSINQLSGAIPTAIGNLSNLTGLYLENNELNGPVPLAVALLGGRIQWENRRDDCRLAPPGNEGLTIPDTQEYRDADLDGDGLICGVAVGGD